MKLVLDPSFRSTPPDSHRDGMTNRVINLNRYSMGQGFRGILPASSPTERMKAG
ncbi:MAG TPA: hypothetical protein PLU73_10470 [Bacteroidia bacterium]|nr:hypothetical protein [Bacteroidia bacterium]